MTVSAKVSQVMLVQAAGSAVAPVNGPPDHVTELVCPAVGALSVALEGVAATAEDAVSNSATKVNPTHFSSFISAPQEGSEPLVRSTP